MKFNVEKMFILPDAGGLLAFCDIGIDATITLRGFRVLRGKKGVFVSFPVEQGKDDKWYDSVLCRDAKTYEKICDVIIKEYNKRVKKGVGI